MKIKMYVRGGGFLIPVSFKPAPEQSIFYNFGIFIEHQQPQIQIFKSRSVKRRWNKIDIETPHSCSFNQSDYTYVVETHLYYRMPTHSTEIKLFSDINLKYCFISEVTNAI